VCADLSLLLNKLNEGFVALAAQLQVTHEAVKVFSCQLLVQLFTVISLRDKQKDQSPKRQVCQTYVQSSVT